MPEILHNIATVQIGTESYQLVRRGTEGTLRREFVDEPPWSEGMPNILSEPSDTWHLGGLKSRPGFPGTSEYGSNTDCRWPNRILPGPQVSTITLTGSVGRPTRFFEALGHLFVLAGRKAYRIDPADDSVVMSKDLYSWSENYNDYFIDGLRWEGDIGIVTWRSNDDDLDIMSKVTALGTPDTWVLPSPTAHATWMAAGIDRLFCVDIEGLLKNIVSGLDPTDPYKHSDLIQCGDTSSVPTGLVAYGKTVLVGKPEGVFGVDAEGLGVPLVKRIQRNDDNFRGMTNVDPYVFLPHGRGVYRWVPGYVESVGIERELLNESIVRGGFNAFAVDGRWILGVIMIGGIGGSAMIMMARDRTEDEAGFGPYVWDTLVYLVGVDCEAIHVSSLWDPPRVFFGHDYNVGYFKVSSGGGAPDVVGTDYRFATSGKRYTRKYGFGDRGVKDFVKVVVVGEGLTANRYWEVYYNVDGGGYSKLDVDGNDMKIDSDGRKTFYLPKTAVGHEIRFYLECTGDSNSYPPELTYFEPFAVPQSRKVPLIPITLRLAEGTGHGVGREARGADKQLNDLITLSESATAIDLKGPWGDFSGWVRKVRVVDMVQEGSSPPELITEALLQRREES